MSEVTIEGSILPSGFLARGERTTVHRDARVDALIAGGYVTVVEEHPGTDLPHLVSPGPEQPTTTPYTRDTPPPRNASRDDWAEFMASFGFITENLSRDELISEWDEHLAAGDPEADPDEE